MEIWVKRHEWNNLNGKIIAKKLKVMKIDSKSLLNKIEL
jgi:hypothetical protein